MLWDVAMLTYLESQQAATTKVVQKLGWQVEGQDQLTLSQHSFNQPTPTRICTSLLLADAGRETSLSARCVVGLIREGNEAGWRCMYLHAVSKRTRTSVIRAEQ